MPQEWLKVINSNGGDIKETYGVPVEEIVEGIKHGVRKVNIDTDLRLASTGAIRRAMAESTRASSTRASSSPRPSSPCATSASPRYEAFGTAICNAPQDQADLLEGMYRYASGELAAGQLKPSERKMGFKG